jgi:hypothetical protein
MEVDKNIDHAKQQIGRAYVCLKRRQWPLYPSTKWSLFNALDNDKFVNLGEASYIKNRNNYGSYKYSMDNMSRKQLDAKVIENMRERFPAAQKILDRFGDKMAICGGFYISLCGSNDIDFFFYNCSTEEAEYMMIESVKIINQTMVCTDSQYVIDEKKLLIRGELTTTVMIKSHYGLYNSRFINYYQFIHRIYPNLGSIMGGFDIPGSMVAYTGKEFVATEQGAWCLTNGYMILDISRRSTTFGIRCSKYVLRGLTAVFPGCNMDTVKDILDTDEAKISGFMKGFQDLQDDFGLRFNDCNLATYHEDYSGYGDNECYHDVSMKKLLTLPVKHMFQDVIYCVNSGDGRIDQYLNDDKMKIARDAPDQENQLSDYSVNCLDKVNMNYDLYMAGKYDSLVSVTELVSNCNGINTIRILMHQNSMVETDIEESFHCPQVTIPGKMKILGIGSSPEAIDENNKMYDILRKTRERLSKIHWMTQDPQRQWSSTVNPAVINANDFYLGKWNGAGAVLTEPVETLLRLYLIGCLRMPKDIFNMIIMMIPYL